MTRLKLLASPLALALAALALDRYVKVWTLGRFDSPGAGFDPIPGLLRLTYVENRGVAFGLFQNNSTLFGIIAVLIIAGVMAYANRWFWQTSLLGRASLALVLAGGLGNVIDRLRYGFVVDTIHLIPLPVFQVFNIADAAISLGAVGLFWTLWREDARQRREQAAAKISEA
ncbi:MAG TPA: signal peptidase II [Herpetosiphonaceae bacterium]